MNDADARHADARGRPALTVRSRTRAARRAPPRPPERARARFSRPNPATASSARVCVCARARPRPHQLTTHIVRCEMSAATALPLAAVAAALPHVPPAVFERLAADGGVRSGDALLLRELDQLALVAFARRAPLAADSTHSPAFAARVAPLLGVGFCFRPGRRAAQRADGRHRRRGALRARGRADRSAGPSPIGPTRVLTASASTADAAHDIQVLSGRASADRRDG